MEKKPPQKIGSKEVNRKITKAYLKDFEIAVIVTTVEHQAPLRESSGMQNDVCINP